MITSFFKIFSSTNVKNPIEGGGSRSNMALDAKAKLVNDFFGGWCELDLKLLSKYTYSDSNIKEVLKERVIVDWLGIKTLPRYHSWYPMSSAGGVLISDIPVPDDQLHAEAIEYLALLTSIERAKSNAGRSYVAIEIGASYGPWLVAAGVLARRHEHFESIQLVGLEANSVMAEEILKHAKLNGLESPGVRVNAVNGAIHTEDALLYFPVVDVSQDNGAQVVNAPSAVDYRGLAKNYMEVEGITLERLLAPYDAVDFIHMDVQGAEAGLLCDENFLKTLTQKVSTFFLATQSRLIEGIALRELSKFGWVLVRERPTVFKQNTRTSDVNGWTLRDGGQIWVNTKINSFIPLEEV